MSRLALHTPALHTQLGGTSLRGRHLAKRWLISDRILAPRPQGQEVQCGWAEDGEQQRRKRESPSVDSGSLQRKVIDILLLIYPFLIYGFLRK